MKRKSDLGGSGGSENESGSFVLGLLAFRKKILKTDMKRKIITQHKMFLLLFLFSSVLFVWGRVAEGLRH